MKSILQKILFAALFIELCLQIYAAYTYLLSVRTARSATNVSRWYESDPSYNWWKYESQDIAPTYSPFLGFLYSDYETPNIHIYESGERLTPRPERISEEAGTSLYLFGGSAMAGYAVKDTETIASKISDVLFARRYPNVGIHNYGQFGYTAAQEEQLARLRIHGGRKTAVIFYHGCNDILASKDGYQDIFFEREARDAIGNYWKFTETKPENTGIADPELIAAIVDKIQLVRIARQLLGLPVRNNKRALPINNTDIDTLSLDIAKHYKKTADRIESLSKVLGFRYLLVWQPVLLGKNMTQEERRSSDLNEMTERLYTSVTNRIIDYHIPNFADRHDFFRDERGTVFLDLCHLTPDGNARIADDLISQLEGIDVLDAQNR